MTEIFEEMKKEFAEVIAEGKKLIEKLKEEKEEK